MVVKYWFVWGSLATAKPGEFPSNMPFYPIGQLVKWLSINSEEGCGSAFGKFFVIQAIGKVETGSGWSFDLLF